MTKRILLAGLLGGAAMFVWSSIAHLVLPLGRAGIQEIPNEQSLLSAMQSSVATTGLYMFPAMSPGASMDQYAQKLASGPSGLLVYHAPGAKALDPMQLLVEFLTELAEAFLLVFVLVKSRVETYAGRFGVIVLASLLAIIATNISYWNWYGFPSSYTAAYMFTQFAGLFLAGLIAAALLKIPAPAAVR